MGIECVTRQPAMDGTRSGTREFHLLDPTESRLLDDWQSNFPLISRPYKDIANALCISEEQVLDLLAGFQSDGTVSRVGPVFRPNTIGVSTLVAVAVAGEAELLEVAAVINQFEAVNHNYEREDNFNLWFVAAAEDADTLNDVLDTIERRIGRDLLRLPLVRDYHIDLGFSMRTLHDETRDPQVSARTECPSTEGLNMESLQSVIHAVQGGLALVPRPYKEVGDRLGWSEKDVLEYLAMMVEKGIIKRLGIVVRHHELGFSANAMVVWDIPDALVDETGETLGQDPRVTLCYRRPRVPGRWPYNLFSMVHGRNRREVLQQVERLAAAGGSRASAHKVLFSGRRFKQQGARYCRAPAPVAISAVEARNNG